MSDTLGALRTSSPELASLLEVASEITHRSVALKAAAKALYLTRPEDKVITTALEQAANEDFKHPETVEALRRLADQIERPYEAALDAAKPAHEDAALMKLFAQARAVVALSLAISPDIQSQAGNALYEALCAGVDQADIRRYITTV